MIRTSVTLKRSTVFFLKFKRSPIIGYRQTVQFVFNHFLSFGWLLLMADMDSTNSRKEANKGMNNFFMGNNL